MGTAFKDKDFAHRFTAMGDEAEGIFEATTDKGFARYGLNRPPIGLGDVPEMIRYTPDYLQHDRLVEVQGIGADRTIKLKVDKYTALMQWNQIFPTWLFVWDRIERTYTEFPIDGFPILLADLAAFPEGKPYFALQAEALPFLWTPRNA